MKIGILGSGMVGQAIGKKLVALGHDVMMGSRAADSDKGREFVAEAQRGAQKGGQASQGTFADASAHGEMVFHCTAGQHALAVIEAAKAGLAGKILVDVSNPLDFSQGFPPRLSVMNDDSLGEQIQRALPAAKVVKALNTVANELMIEPGRLGAPHDLFLCGNDADAKATVTRFLKEELGWTDVVDLGDITNARGTEAWLLLWTRLYAALGTGTFNVHLVRAKA